MFCNNPYHTNTDQESFDKNELQRNDLCIYALGQKLQTKLPVEHGILSVTCLNKHYVHKQTCPSACGFVGRPTKKIRISVL